MNLQWLVENLKQFISTNLFSTLVTAAFGAFAGGWVASRAYTKRQVIAELNAVNSAVMLCVSICNRFISLKKQVVQPLYKTFDERRRAYDTYLAAVRSPQGPRPQAVRLDTDFQKIAPLKTPTEILERYVFEKISIRNKALAAAVQLLGSIGGVDKAINNRNDKIVEFQKASHPDHILALKYFGVQDANGIIDEEYRRSLEAIHSQTDDCIFFSHLLANELFSYGTKYRKKYRWRYLGIPKLDALDWKNAEKFIPPSSEYAGWLKGFQPRPKILDRLTSKWRRAKPQKNPREIES